MKKERILSPVKYINGGIVLPHLKSTAQKETVIMPPPKEVTIPLLQHIGKPAKAVVNKGDKVFVGTLIGEGDGYVSASVHSSVSGTVKELKGILVNGLKVESIVIESDGLMEKDPNLKPFAVKTHQDIIKAAELAGLVGMGGAGFPTKVKLDYKEDAGVDTLIVNAAECEPYITSDYRECIENKEAVLDCVYMLKDILGLKQVIICVESNKEEAIKALYEIATDRRDKEDTVKLMRLPTSYPQGAEKVVIYSATGRMVPAGKLPSDVGCIVMNINSLTSLYEFITTGMPVVAKRVTVDGDAVKEPKNVIVPIGTSISELLDFAGGAEEIGEVIFGGPMMGIDACDINSPIEKRTNAITVLKEKIKPQTATPCIKCGRCAAACPMNLYPASVEAAINYSLKERLLNLNVSCCMECGCCAYVCPAKRPLTQVMRLAKAEIKRSK